MAVADILVTPVTLWLAGVGEALPDETSVAFGDAWGGAWTDMGLTTAPLTLSYNPEYFELDVQQSATPVRRILTSEEFMMETVLAEQTGANIALALNGTATTTASGAGQVAYDRVQAGGSSQLSTYTVGFEGRYTDDNNVSFPVRYFFHLATIALNGNLAFSKSDAAGIPIQIKALGDTTKLSGTQTLEVHKVTAAAS